MVQEFDTYKKSVTIEKLTESIQLTFNQELNDLRQSLTNLVSKVENLPEVFKQILDPITQVSHEVSSGQLNLAGSIQGQIEGQYFISIEIKKAFCQQHGSEFSFTFSIAICI